MKKAGNTRTESRDEGWTAEKQKEEERTEGGQREEADTVKKGAHQMDRIVCRLSTK